MKMQLHDLIGRHSGMNYYLDSFSLFLNENSISTTIHSNYNHNKNCQYYAYIFKASKFEQIFLLLTCYTKYLYSILKLHKNEFIIVSIFGTIIDIPLLLLSRLNKRVILDVHEVIELDIKKSIVKKLFKSIYNSASNRVISHSKKTTKVLKGFGYKKQLLFVPHIHYKIDTDYYLENIADDIKDCFEDNYKYFLFFGHIRPSKGIYELLATFEVIKGNRNIFKIIIAGQDTDNLLMDYERSFSKLNNIIIITRYINGDEMKYLYKKSDFILLPYRDISQSGILEMAITFRKPILASSIAYFQDIITKYPSFGQLTNSLNAHEFAESIISLTENSTKKTFYNETDIENYANKKCFNKFISDLKEMNSNLS